METIFEIAREWIKGAAKAGDLRTSEAARVALTGDLEMVEELLDWEQESLEHLENGDIEVFRARLERARSELAIAELLEA